jgi:hypothetical protein
MPPKSADVTLKGQVTDLFAHRFVVATAKGKFLADLGPKGAEAVQLAVGDDVTLTGEQKPSELKVHSLVLGGREYQLKREPSGGDAETAVAAVRALGFEPLEPPSRRPKHFEILARRGDERREFHVEFDGAIRKTKPAKGERP